MIWGKWYTYFNLIGMPDQKLKSYTKSNFENKTVSLPSSFFFGLTSFLGLTSSSGVCFITKGAGWGPGGGAEGPVGPDPEGVNDEVNNPVALCWIFRASRTQDAMASR